MAKELYKIVNPQAPAYGATFEYDTKTSLRKYIVGAGTARKGKTERQPVAKSLEAGFIKRISILNEKVV